VFVLAAASCGGGDDGGASEETGATTTTAFVRVQLAAVLHQFDTRSVESLPNPGLVAEGTLDFLRSPKPQTPK
jgi:hypothetical protein